MRKAKEGGESWVEKHHHAIVSIVRTRASSIGYRIYSAQQQWQ